MDRFADERSTVVTAQFVSELSPEQQEQHVRDSHSQWGRSASVEERLQLLQMRLKKHGPRLFSMSGLVNDDGKLVASLKKYYFTLKLDGAEGLCVGLGAVFTHPDFRRSGLAESMIRKVLENARLLEGCKFSMLYSDIHPTYYEKFGFQKTPSLNWVSQLNQLGIAASSLALRKATSADVEVMRGLFLKQGSASQGHVLRSQQSWTLFREINSITDDYVVEERGRAVGFLTTATVPAKGYLWIEDGFVEPGFEIWPTISQLASKEGLSELRGWHTNAALRPPSATLSPREKQIPMIMDLERPNSIRSSVLSDTLFTPADHF